MIIGVQTAVLTANIYAAIDFNKARHYTILAIRTIQRKIGAPVTGKFDTETIAAIYNWQKSPNRLKKLDADGKFGSSSLGVLIAELAKRGENNSAETLRQFPHYTMSGEIYKRESAKPIYAFHQFDSNKLDLKRNEADDTRWIMKGCFNVEMYIDRQIIEPARYEYRQYIKGRVYIQDGYFGDKEKKVWQARAGAPVEEVNDYMRVPKLSPTSFHEDGEVMRNRSIERFGYRNRKPTHLGERPGLMDYYSENQLGWEYRLQDTFGIEGPRKRDDQGNYRMGLKIGIDLQFRGVAIKDGKTPTTEQINSGNWRDYCAASKEWNYKGEKIVDW